MQKVQLHTSKGFSMVEMILSIAIFLVFVTSISGLIYGSWNQTKNAINKDRATYLAKEAIELSRNLRDSNFLNLVDGTHGLFLNGNTWEYSGSSDTTDIFTREITVLPISENQKQLTSVVTWADYNGSNSVTLSTYLTNFRKITQTTCTDEQSFLDVDISGAVLTNNNRRLAGITIGNTADDCDIVITDISLTWTSNRRLQEISIDGSSLWSGSAGSGATNDITDFTLAPGQSGVETVYRFNNSVAGNTFTITFTMFDGTTKTVSDILP